MTPPPTTQIQPAPETHDAGNELMLEYYRNIRERLSSQGDRLWARFQYFLTVDTALTGAFLVVPQGLTESWRGVGIPLLGGLWSLLWFLLAANDLWFYEERYTKLKAFEKDSLLPLIKVASKRMASRDLPAFKRFICFKIPKVGATSFCSIVPAAFAAFWIVVAWL